MKILYLHQYFATNETGGATRSYEFSKFLSENDHQIVVITATNINKEFNKNFTVVSTNTNYSNHMGNFRRILSFLSFTIKSFYKGLKIKNLDLVFATSTPLTIGLPAVLIAKIKNKPLIFEVRDVWPDVPVELGYLKNKLLIKILKIFEPWIYNNSKHIIVLSKGMYDNLLKKGISPNKITVIENIANLYLYNGVSDARKAEKYKDKFICIHPGTMGHVNGLDFVLDVAKFIQDHDKDILFLLIGEGKKKEYLIQRVKDEKIQNVIFDNSKPKREIAQIIKSSDLGIMCVDNKFKILEDNSANKFFDFLAAGLPVMVNYGGWQKEIIEEYECGESNPDPKIMAERLIAIKNDQEKRIKMGLNSRKLAEEKYSDIIAKKKLRNIIENHK
ncbi:MAG: glycosyltransferase family 4 protein [Candidatus Delongbacteria bacterium]|nr:glycosyltransferase family 4 protein [Candidatus Delongbacteria bacterium]